MGRFKRTSDCLALIIALSALIGFLGGPAPGAAVTAGRAAAGDPPAGTSTAASVLIATDVFSSGGREGTSASFKIHDTFGQGPIGPIAVGTTIELQDGFWATISAKGGPSDTEPPGPVAVFETFPQDASIGLRGPRPPMPILQAFGSGSPLRDTRARSQKEIRFPTAKRVSSTMRLESAMPRYMEV
jgi:hypothetical protein